MTDKKRIGRPARITVTVIALVLIIVSVVAIYFAYKAYSGMNVALDTAFADAKILSENARAVDVDVQLKNRGFVYDVEFYSDRQKYEYTVDSKGEILFVYRQTEEGNTAQISVDSSSQKYPESETVSDISEQHAKQLALSHANINEKSITDYDSDIETVGGIKVYEIEFKYSGYEYNYYINASNGAIVKFYKERD